MLHEDLESLVTRTVSESILFQRVRGKALNLTRNVKLDEVTEELFTGEVLTSEVHPRFCLGNWDRDVQWGTFILW